LVLAIVAAGLAVLATFVTNVQLEQRGARLTELEQLRTIAVVLKSWTYGQQASNSSSTLLVELQWVSLLRREGYSFRRASELAAKIAELEYFRLRGARLKQEFELLKSIPVWQGNETETVSSIEMVVNQIAETPIFATGQALLLERERAAEYFKTPELSEIFGKMAERAERNIEIMASMKLHVDTTEGLIQRMFDWSNLRLNEEASRLSVSVYRWRWISTSLFVLAGLLVILEKIGNGRRA
jgi:hypothetical protein